MRNLGTVLRPFQHYRGHVPILPTVTTRTAGAEFLRGDDVDCLQHVAVSISIYLIRTLEPTFPHQIFRRTGYLG